MGEHIGNSVPLYMGFVPGKNSETHHSYTIHSRQVDRCRQERSRASYDRQALDKGKRDEADRLARSLPPPKAPMHDNRGHFHPPAGDTKHSRIPAEGEEKFHLQCGLGLTSHAHEDRGGFGNLRGFGSASRGIPGFTGYVPGKLSENVFGDGFSKQCERSVASHLRAVRKGPKEMSLLSEAGTLVAPTAADSIDEIPLRNPSYQCRVRGWSGCEFSGIDVDAAGRNAPMNRQEGYGGKYPPPSKSQIHGYTGWVPGRVGESVVGERQCKTNDIADHLFKKNRMRITQR